MNDNSLHTPPFMLRLVALGVLGLCSLSGCQYLGPGGQPTQIPEIMKIKNIWKIYLNYNQKN